MNLNISLVNVFIVAIIKEKFNFYVIRLYIIKNLNFIESIIKHYIFMYVYYNFYTDTSFYSYTDRIKAGTKLSSDNWYKNRYGAGST